MDTSTTSAKTVPPQDTFYKLITRYIAPNPVVESQKILDKPIFGPAMLVFAYAVPDKARKKFPKVTFEFCIEEWVGDPNRGGKKIRDIPDQEITALALLYSEKAKTLVAHVTAVFKQKMPEVKPEPHHILREVAFASRNLEIQRDMGVGLPDDQRACYKARDPGALKALELTHGDLSMANALLKYVYLERAA
jgi:hypothetical protein